MSVRNHDVTACLVTKGDRPDELDRIIDSLIFDQVIVWDNSVRDHDWKCAGRYMAAAEASTRFVYFQDDDVLVPPETQRALMAAWEPGVPTATYAHGLTPDGYDDLPLVCAGAIVEPGMCADAISRYAEEWPLDDAFGYEADFVVGVLYPWFKHVRLPFEILMEVAQSPERLCNQPWQRALKLEVAGRARLIRDRVRVAA